MKFIAILVMLIDVPEIDVLDEETARIFTTKYIDMVCNSTVSIKTSNKK